VARWVLHVDLDQFVAAVEILRRPELRGLPVVVGGDGDPSRRGVVSTASYQARRYGVHSGQPLRTAARLCPDAVFLPVDREAYEAASATVMATLRGFDAIVQVLGWDEAFLAVHTDDPAAVAAEIQRRVRAATALDCTVGIGTNRIQAKLATGFGKPAGIFTITPDTWYGLLGDRPPDALWGIGAKTAKRLAALGITTVAGLAGTDPGSLADAFGPATGPWLVRLARGAADWTQVRREVARLARLVADDAAELRVARVVVKVRYAPFHTHTHGHSLAEPTTDADRIERAALAALDDFAADRPVRLLGVRAEFPR
jgi:DNA polymerase-4